MENVCSLIPREPPKGFLEWAAKELSGELNVFGFLYEQQWVEDWGLEYVLDEWAKPRKLRMVRVECSCCGYQDLYHYSPDSHKGYGFVLPESYTEVEGGTAYGDGDEMLCPQCGTPVLIRKKSTVRKKGYFVTAEARAMSISLVGRDRLLALSCWTIQRQTSVNGHARLSAIPTEAYVFAQADCAQLKGWVKGYSGTVGYFIQYNRSWRQPAVWNESWGQEEHIFGLTADLIAASCLPHCKLDVYMTERPGARHYPVAWLRLCQVHPNAEVVLIHGLPRVLDDLLQERCREVWKKNVKGLPRVPELNWRETRPAKILGLTKNELCLAREQDWGMLFWNLCCRSKAVGETLTRQDYISAFCLGDEYVDELAGQGPVSKSIRYLLKQRELCEHNWVPESEDEDPAPDAGIPDVHTLVDYWEMARMLGCDLSDNQIRFPHNLMAAHDAVADEAAKRKEASLAALFRIRRKQLSKWTFSWHGLMIRPAASQAELTDEGNSLHHCVSRYGKSHAEGETAIFFIRRKKHPKESFYTLELDERKMKVRQNRGMRNCPRTPEIQKFENLWLDWIRMGCPKERLDLQDRREIRDFDFRIYN